MIPDISELDRLARRAARSADLEVSYGGQPTAGGLATATFRWPAAVVSVRPPLVAMRDENTVVFIMRATAAARRAGAAGIVFGLPETV
jgi:hypothetical protein